MVKCNKVSRCCGSKANDAEYELEYENNMYICIFVCQDYPQGPIKYKAVHDSGNQKIHQMLLVVAAASSGPICSSDHCK